MDGYFSSISLFRYLRNYDSFCVISQTPTHQTTSTLLIRQRAEKNKDKINPDTTGQPAHKRAKIPRSNKRTIEDMQLYTYSLSDVRKAAEEEIRQMKKKRRLQNDAQMTQDPNTNSHIRIEIT